MPVHQQKKHRNLPQNGCLESKWPPSCSIVHTGHMGGFMVDMSAQFLVNPWNWCLVKIVFSFSIFQEVLLSEIVENLWHRAWPTLIAKGESHFWKLVSRTDFVKENFPSDATDWLIAYFDTASLGVGDKSWQFSATQLNLLQTSDWFHGASMVEFLGALGTRIQIFSKMGVVSGMLTRSALKRGLIPLRFGKFHSKSRDFPQNGCL